MTTKAKLTVGDVLLCLEDERHLGFGYACRDYITSQARQGQLDRAVVAVANELGLDAEEFFHWTNSKYGRWLCDGVVGRNESPTRATVRGYLNADAVKVAQEF